MWTQEFIFLAWQTLKAKSPKSLTPSAKVNCDANLWIRGLPASVVTQPLETRLVVLKGIYHWFGTVQFALFSGGGRGGGAGDFTTEGLWLDVYHELVPIDLEAFRSSMVLLDFVLISSFSIMYPSLPLLFLWNKHSSGKIKNSKQRPLDLHSYIHWGGRTVRQSIKKAFFITVFSPVCLEGQ